MDREYSGEGGRLILTDSGELYGAGWDLTYPYSVEYSEEKAKAAEPVKIAENVISASAGYNYALYVTDDGKLHFVGDTGKPYKERFSFDGKIKEVFAMPDRDRFSLIDENGDTYVWGDNHCTTFVPYTQTLRAVVNDQSVTLRDGVQVWEFKKDGVECRRVGPLRNYPPCEKRGVIRMRLKYSKVVEDLIREYGSENLLFKYVLRSKSDFRDIASDDWSDEEFKDLPGIMTTYPHGEGITDVRRGAYSGLERDYTYSVGIYTTNYYIYVPVKLEEPQETDDETKKAEEA